MKTELTANEQRKVAPVILKYGTAVLSVVIALLITKLLQIQYGFEPFVAFICAMMVSVWFGGVKPGLLAVALSLFAFYHYFLHPNHPLDVAIRMSRLLSAALTALFVVWLCAAQRSATDSLRRTNESLRAEIAERKRTEALLEGQKRVLEMMAGGAPLSGSLAALTRLMEEQFPGMLCSILLLDERAGRLIHSAAPSLPPEYVAAIEGLRVGPAACSCGTAAYRKEPVFVEDIATDPRWKDYRAVALPHGLRACWSTPIFDSQRQVLGTFAMFYRQPGLPQPEHLRLIEIATHIAAIAICGHRAQAERIESEAALKRSEARKTAILDSALDCIVTIDHEACITEFNPAAERAFGYRRDEVVGRRLADVIIPPALREEHRRGFARYLATGEARVLGRRIEMPAVRADGSEFPVELAITRIPLEGPPCFTGYLRDITEPKRAEAELRHSHEQLRALTGRLETLREAERIRISREIHDELGQKLTGLKMDLLWMEQHLGELGSLPAVNAILDRAVWTTELVDGIIATVQEIAAELRPSVLDKLGLGTALQYEGHRFQDRTGIPCEVRIPEMELALSVEVSTALFRIFQELLTNVARHAHAAKVETELKAQPGFIVLSLRDNGKGITEADIAHPQSLGLLGIKERAALLGGEVVFQAHPGQGTNVTVRIPMTGVAPAIGKPV